MTDHSLLVSLRETVVLQLARYFLGLTIHLLYICIYRLLALYPDNIELPYFLWTYILATYIYLLVVYIDIDL